MARVERELKARAAPPPWRAFFVSVLALAWPDGAARDVRGAGRRRRSSSRRAGRPGSATIRSFAPTATTARSARWRPRRSTAFRPTARLRSRIARGRSRGLRAPGFDGRAGACPQQNQSAPPPPLWGKIKEGVAPALPREGIARLQFRPLALPPPRPAPQGGRGANCRLLRGCWLRPLSRPQLSVFFIPSSTAGLSASLICEGPSLNVSLSIAPVKRNGTS